MFKQHDKSLCILYSTQKSDYGTVVGLVNISQFEFVAWSFFIIRLPTKFLPASGPTEQWCCLLISSRAGYDLGSASRLV